MKMGIAGSVATALVAASLATSATAQRAVTPSAAPAPQPAVDPARLAAAVPVIDQVWPMGTYARIMHGVMNQMTQGMMSSMYDMRPEDFMAGDKSDAHPEGKPDDGKTAKPDGKTLGETMRDSDPYFQQRTDITMRVIFDEMGKLMTEVEPEVRHGLAKSYARRFSVAQLGELQRFFASDTGHAYAADSMLLMMGPDMMQAMQSFAPRIIKAMPAIFAKVAEATKDLPPPPKKAPKP